MFVKSASCGGFRCAPKLQQEGALLWAYNAAAQGDPLLMVATAEEEEEVQEPWAVARAANAEAVARAAAAESSVSDACHSCL